MSSCWSQCHLNRIRLGETSCSWSQYLLVGANLFLLQWTAVITTFLLWQLSSPANFIKYFFSLLVSEVWSPIRRSISCRLELSWLDFMPCLRDKLVGLLCLRDELAGFLHCWLSVFRPLAFCQSVWLFRHNNCLPLPISRCLVILREESCNDFFIILSSSISCFNASWWVASLSELSSRGHPLMMASPGGN